MSKYQINININILFHAKIYRIRQKILTDNGISTLIWNIAIRQNAFYMYYINEMTLKNESIYKDIYTGVIYVQNHGPKENFAAALSVK